MKKRTKTTISFQWYYRGLYEIELESEGKLPDERDIIKFIRKYKKYWKRLLVMNDDLQEVEMEVNIKLKDGE